MRAEHLDTLVWDHITGLLAGSQLIRTEIDRRPDSSRTANPAAQQRKRRGTALVKTSNAIVALIEAFGEQLITIDVLRARMPDLCTRETNLRNQIEALDSQLADRDAYLKLASQRRLPYLAHSAGEPPPEASEAAGKPIIASCSRGRRPAGRMTPDQARPI